MANILTEAQIERIIRISGLYEERWITDEDVEDAAAFVGAISAEGVYNPTYDARVMIECLQMTAVRSRSRPAEIGAVSSPPEGRAGFAGDWRIRRLEKSEGRGATRRQMSYRRSVPFKSAVAPSSDQNARPSFFPTIPASGVGSWLRR